MTLLESLSDSNAWNEFLEYKLQSGNLSKTEEKDLQDFITRGQYREINVSLDMGIHQKRAILKLGTTKKRIVYTYPPSQNYILKLLTFLLLRKYDNIFAPNLYSFRIRYSAKEAIEYIRRDRLLDKRFIFKIDIQDYFNSVDVSLMLPSLKTP